MQLADIVLRMIVYFGTLELLQVLFGLLVRLPGNVVPPVDGFRNEPTAPKTQYHCSISVHVCQFVLW